MDPIGTASFRIRSVSIRFSSCVFDIWIDQDALLGKSELREKNARISRDFEVS